MDTSKSWIKRNCNMDRVMELSHYAESHELDALKTVLYSLLVFGLVVLLVRTATQKLSDWRKTKTYNRLPPRSPDPEKTTDVTSYAEKRMKPTDRAPGSKHVHWAYSCFNR